MSDLYFFLDQDDFEFEGKVYRAFHYFGDLKLSRTLEHVRKLPSLKNLTHGEHEGGEGWWMRFTFCGEQFLVDTWYHGTSTTLNVLNRDCDDQILLALIGCFAPIRCAPVSDVTHPSGTVDVWGPQNIFLYFLFGLIGAFIAMCATLHTTLD